MKTKYLFLILIIFLFVYPTAINAQLKQTVTQVAGKAVKIVIWQGREIQFAKGEIAIKINTTTTQAQINELFNKVGGKIINSFDKLGWGLIELPSGKDEILAIEDLKKLPFVVTSEPNMVTKVDVEPNDPYFKGTSPATYPYQWALKNTGQTPPSGTIDADVDAPEAWNITTGNSDVIIAILDTGIPMLNGSLSHPDLDDTNKIILGPDCTDEVDGTVKDNFGHGTHVSGIAAAESNNDTGIVGVAWNCKIMPIQVFDAYGSGFASYFYNGVKYAVDYQSNNPNKRVVINYSGGGGESQQELDAVIYANTYGVPIIASAGNSYGEAVSYPAAYSLYYSNVIAVSATDQNDVISSYSSIGPEVNVSAPGGWGKIQDGNVVRFNTTGNLGRNIFSTTPNYTFNIQTDPSYPGDPYSTDVTQSYGYLAGTSMAAPQVTGLAGLILSVNPNLTPSQIRYIIQNSADDKGTEGRDNYYGYGRINAYNALKYTLENYGGLISHNFTIPAGETWHFQRGVKIIFAPGTSLIVNGILTAIGQSINPITFTSQSGTTNSSWGTITLNGSGAAGSTIKYANIKYGTKVEAINTSNITIQYCNIDTTYDGIRFNNSSGSILNNKITSNSFGHGIVIENGSTNVTVNDNIITKNYTYFRNGVGIYFGGGAGGKATRNDIYGWDWGICAIWGSSPSSYSSEVMQKNNRIRNCNTGFMVYRLSYAAFGYPSSIEHYSLNSLSNNSYNARVGTAYSEFESRLYAYSNWWGSDPPNTSLFQVGYSSQFYYSPYLDFDPWAGLPKLLPITNNNETTLSKGSSIPVNDINSLLVGIELRLQNKLFDAKNYFMSYLAAHPDNQQAYVELYNCYSKETADEIIKFFNSLPDKASKDHKLLLSYLYLKNGDVKTAMEVNNTLIAENPNTELSARAKLNNVYITLYNENNISEAIKVFNEVAGKIELSNLMELYLVRDAIETYGKTYSLEVKGLSALPDFETTEEKLNKQDGMEIPDQYALLGNYPNPFNPSTTISYALPYQSSVELIIYDLMGREVKRFNVSSESAGYNKLVWDGRNENGNFVSSGVYFYRISIKSLENNETFIKTAKLIMMK